MKTRMLGSMLVVLGLVLAGCSGDEAVPLAPQPEVTLQAGAPAGTSEVMVLPPETSPGGLTYPEWSVKWWQWLWSAPVDQNPGLDATGEFVDWNQAGHVWYLAPAYFGTWERSAKIPTGTMLFIDLAANFTALTTLDGTNEEELRAAAAWATNNVTDIILRIDDWQLDNVENYRFISPPGYFGYTLPENNMFEFFGLDAPAGTYSDAVADGYYAMVKPLSMGEHTVFMSATLGEPYNDIVQVTYHLNVVGRHRTHCRTN